MCPCCWSVIWSQVWSQMCRTLKTFNEPLVVKGDFNVANLNWGYVKHFQSPLYSAPHLPPNNWFWAVALPAPHLPSNNWFWAVALPAPHLPPNNWFWAVALPAAGKVQFEVLADGGEDEGGIGEASIKVNGVDYCPKKPGHNIVVLDPTGEVVVAKNFNTNAGQGAAMGQFLDEIPEEHVVLIATQGVTSKEQGRPFKCCPHVCLLILIAQDILLKVPIMYLYFA